jgi:hypothetical protein
MHTNVLGPMMALPLLLPFVEAGNHGRGGVLAVLSSHMGSIGAMDSNRSWLYRVSKAAANAALKAVSLDTRPCDLRGTASGLGADRHGRPGRPHAAQSVTGMRRVLAGLTRTTTAASTTTMARPSPGKGIAPCC